MGNFKRICNLITENAEKNDKKKEVEQNKNNLQNREKEKKSQHTQSNL